MADIQRTIDNIRSILASTGVTSVDDIAAASAEFAEACQVVNDRLRKCGQFLREGLRSEAIQQSEAEPNLLGLVSTLDIPELAEWNSLVQSCGLATAQPLLVEVAADLNEAYSQEQPLGALLRKHRLQALRRSPLRDRILTLRRLAEMDGNNPVWQDDLRTYEQARHQEIRQTVDDGARQGNVALLDECARDLREEHWLAPPPPALVQHVADVYNRVSRKQARRELERLEPQLNDAFAQFDEAQARALRDRWNRFAEVEQLSESDPLYERAAPALEWLARQDQDLATEDKYQSAVASLERALDDEEDLATLERLAHAVLRCERPIPPLIERRLASRVTDLRLTRTRRLRMIIAAAVLLFVALGGAVIYAVYQQRHDALVATHMTTLQIYVERNQLDEAQKHLDQLTATLPHVASHPDVQTVALELVNKRQAEETRLKNFQAAIEAAEKAGLEKPNREALKQAESLARLDAEKARVLKLQTAIAAVERRQQAERNEAFLERLKAIRPKIDALDRDNPDPEKLAAVRSELAQLMVKSEGISPAVFSQAKIEEKRINTLSELLTRRGMAQDALQAVDVAVGQPERYRAALVTFADKLPDAPQSVDFKRVAEESAIWSQISDWNAFVDQWNANDVARLTADQIVQLLGTCKQFLEKHPEFPTNSAVEGKIKHLEAIQRRNGPDGKLHSPLNELFTDPLIATLWLVETKDEKGELARYYLIAPPPELLEKQASVQLAHMNDFARVANKQVRVRVADITYSGEAPQSKLAKQAMDVLARSNEELWEALFGRILGMIQSDQQLDPILKVILLQRVLEIACEGSESMRLAFVQYREILESVTIDPTVPWMDLKNEDTRRTRELASELLNRLPPFPQVLRQAAVNLNEFKTSPGPKYEWIGWLNRGTAGAWECRLGRTPNRDCKLLVMQSADDKKSFDWVAIGNLKSGKSELDREKPGAFLAGRPVFAESSAFGK